MEPHGRPREGYQERGVALANLGRFVEAAPRLELLDLKGWLVGKLVTLIMLVMLVSWFVLLVGWCKQPSTSGFTPW